MQIDPNTLHHTSTYKLLTGAVIPRPIGWISTVNAAGQPNLAPFSFFNVVCANPPTVLFCPGVRGVNRLPKDTLQNARETGQFVVNIVTEATAAAMNITATDLPPEVNEFEEAGLTPIPSARVRPPRVAESPVHFECEVQQIVEINPEPGGGYIVIGRVVMIHVQDDLLIGTDKIDIARLQAVGRLAGGGYCRVNDIFTLERLPGRIQKPGG